MLMNFKTNGIEKYNEIVYALVDTRSYSSALMKMEIDLKNRPILLVKPSIEELHVLELQKLLGHIRYVFLDKKTNTTVIVVAKLVESQVEAFFSVLSRYKKAIGWTIVEFIDISLGI